jgi:hypothetical protein
MFGSRCRVQFPIRTSTHILIALNIYHLLMVRGPKVFPRSSIACTPSGINLHTIDTLRTWFAVKIRPHYLMIYKAVRGSGYSGTQAAVCQRRSCNVLLRLQGTQAPIVAAKPHGPAMATHLIHNGNKACLPTHRRSTLVWLDEGIVIRCLCFFGASNVVNVQEHTKRLNQILTLLAC